MTVPRLYDRRAFSLVELLAVIAIIGILAAILIPTLGKIRENAQTSRCVANLRTWHNATSVYVADNKGKLPPTEFKMVNVQGANLAQDAYLYLDRYLVSPKHPCYTWGYNQTLLADYTCTTRTDAGNGLVWAAYGFNHYLSSLAPVSIANPSRLIWATEAAGGSGGQRWITPGMLTPSCVNLGATTSKPHGLKNNILYLDGHVSVLALHDVFKADFTRDTPSYNAADESVRLAN